MSLAAAKPPPQALPTSPLFIKGMLTFTLRGQSYSFRQQDISAVGASGLPWDGFDPVLDLGQSVDLTLRFPTEPPLNLQGKATITGEKSIGSSSMGLRFLLGPEQKALLKSHILTHGFIPTESLRRKYPRIPSLKIIQIFPMHALAYPPKEALPPNLEVISFDVENLSPTGLLMTSESIATLHIEPGMRLRLTLQPRGWFPTAINTSVQICRIMDERSESSGNLKRRMGVRFLKIDDSHRTAFADLIRGIIDELRRISPQGT